MSGDDNIHDIHDEDEHVFDEDFILDKDEAPGKKAGEEDHDEEPAFDDDEAFVLSDEPAASSPTDTDDDLAFVLEDEPVPAAGAGADADMDFVLEEEDTAPVAALGADDSGHEIEQETAGEEFILQGEEDLEETAAARSLDDLFSSDPQQPEEPALQPEEGALFDAAAFGGENEFGVGDDRQFVEEGGLGWDGDDTDPESLGVSKPEAPKEAPSLGDAQELLDADAAALEIEGDPELELVEFDADLDTPPGTASQAPQESEDDALWVLEGDEAKAAASAASAAETQEAKDAEEEPTLVLDIRDDAGPGEGWEPLDDSISLDADGAPDPYQEHEHAYDEGVDAGAEPEPDYSEHEEQFVDQHGLAETGEPHVLGPLEPPRRRPLRTLLAVAATILLVGLAGVAYVKPRAFLDVFGVKPVEVEVVKINRPGVDVDVTVPNVDIKLDTPPVAKPPAPKPPAPKPPVAKVPVTKVPVTKPPVAKPPAPKPPMPKPPVAKVPAPKPPVPYVPPPPPAPVRAPNTGLPKAVQLNPLDKIPFGEDRDDGYMKGSNKGNLNAHNSPEALKRKWDLVMGSKALAQLMNNNIFFGRVKALDSRFVTLRFDRGEVSLPLADVRVLTHLAFDEYQSLKRQGKDGFVYLRNNNRLGGLIVAQRDDSVILQVQSNRVIIPKTEIEHIQEVEKKVVQFSEEDTLDQDDWVRRLVEERLRNKPKRVMKDPGTVSVPDQPSSKDKR